MMDAVRVAELLLQLRRASPPAPTYKPWPSFSGLNHECPHAFLRACEDAFEARKTPDEEWVHLAISQLHHDAADWCKKYDASVFSWRTFSSAFQHQYASQRVLAALRADLYGRVQSTQEAAERFVLQKHRLLRRLEPQVPESEAVSIFIEQLTPAVRSFVRTMRPSTLLDLIDAATSIEEDLEEVGFIGTTVDIADCFPAGAAEAGDLSCAVARVAPRSVERDGPSSPDDAATSPENGHISAVDDVVHQGPVPALSSGVRELVSYELNIPPATEKEDREDVHQVHYTPAALKAPFHDLVHGSLCSDSANEFVTLLEHGVAEGTYCETDINPICGLLQVYQGRESSPEVVVTPTTAELDLHLQDDTSVSTPDDEDYVCRLQDYPSDTAPNCKRRKTNVRVVHDSCSARTSLLFADRQKSHINKFWPSRKPLPTDKPPPPLAS